MILQAYDFLELHRREGCLLQMGGSDQWGNIVNGIDLTRRVAGAEVFGLTSPLLDHRRRRQDGQDRRRRGLAQRRDAGALRLLAVLAQHRRRRRRPVPEALHRAAGRRSATGSARSAAPRSTPRRSSLANEVTTLCHGAEAAAAAEATAREVFERGGVGDDLPTLTLAPGDIPEGGISVVQLLVRAGLAGSGKDARRLIAEGGARLDDAALTDAGPAPRRRARCAAPRKLSAGRKRHALVRLESAAAADLAAPTDARGASARRCWRCPTPSASASRRWASVGDAFRRVAAGADRDLVRPRRLPRRHVARRSATASCCSSTASRRLRFVLSLALMGAIHLVGALVTTATALARRRPRRRPRPRLRADARASSRWRRRRGCSAS